MRYPKQLLSTAVLIAPTTMMLAACMGTNGVLRAPGSHSGADGTILASIGGISDEDATNGAFTYKLNCGSAGIIDGTTYKDGGKDFVKFAGDKIKDDVDSCSMEIRSDKWAKDATFIWYGRDEKNQPIVGLAYASDEQPVKARKLSLKLYKLVSKVGSDSFAATAAVQFDSIEATPAKGTASLVCGDKLSFPGLYEVKAGQKTALLKFPDLKVDDFKAIKACTQLVVLSDGKKYGADAADILFKAPPAKADPLREFGKTTPYAMTLLSIATDVAIDTSLCRTGLSADGKTCLDKAKVTMPWAKSLMIAKVVVKAPSANDHETTTRYVAAGPKGIGIFDGSELTVADLTKALAKDSTTAASFVWYADGLDTDLFSQNFGAGVMDGSLVASHAVDRHSLENYEVLSISDVYVHGFHKLDGAALDKKPSATWLGLIKATKTGQTDAQFLVSGYDEYFHSAAAPTIGGKATYFDFKTLADDMASANGSDKWRLYGLKGGAMAPTGCAAELSTYVAETSLKSLDQLVPASPFVAVDGCRIAKGGFNADLKTYDIAVTFYAWEWFTLAK